MYEIGNTDVYMYLYHVVDNKRGLEILIGWPRLLHLIQRADTCDEPKKKQTEATIQLPSLG